MNVFTMSAKQTLHAKIKELRKKQEEIRQLRI